MYSKEELKNLKLEFWESFAAFCEVQPYLRGRKKIWTLYDTKVKGVELKFDANRQGAYVIYVAKEGLDLHRRAHWGDFFTFMASQMYLLERNFMGIAEYLRE